jgi:hypothetical protein
LFLVKYIPSWVPWFSYKPLIKTVRRLSEKTRNDPINFVKNAMVSPYSPTEFAWTDDTVVRGDRNEVIGERASAGDRELDWFRASEERRDYQDYLGVNIFR